MQIDFYPAGKDCVLIFTGLGGDTKGYENKYVRLADEITAKSGFSVFVAGVPADVWSHPQDVFERAVSCVTAKLSPEKIYVMGSSAGASIAVWYSHLYPQIKKVLAVNAVLNLNYHRTREGIEKFAGEKMFVRTGGLDPCAVWINLLPQKQNLSVELLKDIDHVFSGKTEEFISLPIKTLFEHNVFQ